MNKMVCIMENSVMINIDNYNFFVPIEIYKYLERTKTLDTIELKETKTGVKTLKFPSITYAECIISDNNQSFITKSENQLNILKSRKKEMISNKLINIEKGEKIKMKVTVKFMKRPVDTIKDKNGKNIVKKTGFEKFVDTVLTPKLFNLEFENWEDVKKVVNDIIPEMTKDNSTWVVEDNTKTPGLVLKNTYIFTKNDEKITKTNICFINEYKPVEKK